MSEVDVVLWIGTVVLFLAFPPAFWFTLDYGLLTPLRRRGAPGYIPWWKNGIGVMWFGFGATIMLLTLTVAFSRVMATFYGLNWPGREWVTLVSYTGVAALVVLSTFVYAVEKRTPSLQLVPEDIREAEAERAQRIASIDADR